MFSEGLRLLDAGTVQYMIEDQQAQIEKLQQQRVWAEQRQAQTAKALAEKEAEIARLEALLAEG